MDIHHVIVRPLLTEKSTHLNTLKKYTIVVHPDATKIDIKKAIEQIYSTKVKEVAILKNPGKQRIVGRGRVIPKRRPLKKAIVTLQKGEKPIDFIKTKKKK
jgi:large subunit ribosomal protein L23